MEVTLAQAAGTIVSVVGAFGGGSLYQGLISARKNNGDYILQAFEQLLQAQTALTVEARGVASTCAEKLAQADQTVQILRSRLFASEIQCHKYALRLIDVGALTPEEQEEIANTA